MVEQPTEAEVESHVFSPLVGGYNDALYGYADILRQLSMHSLQTILLQRGAPMPRLAMLTGRKTMTYMIPKNSNYVSYSLMASLTTSRSSPDAMVPQCSGGNTHSASTSELVTLITLYNLPSCSN